MRILFAFENPLPSAEADAEVFVTTAKHLAVYARETWLHVPLSKSLSRDEAERLVGMPVIPAWAPRVPAALRHLACGLTIVLRREFREADLVYTRNLWIAFASIIFGQRVVFDHYRPWPDQIPPLQRLIYWLLCSPRFIVNICHSNYTVRVYRNLGVPDSKLACIHNGYSPQRFRTPVPLSEAKRRLGLDPVTPTVVYTGRINHKKGLDVVLAAAARLPRVRFLLVGSYGEGPIEREAASIPNVIIVPWQVEDGIADYLQAADILLIPPSLKPLSQFGSTVLPLKLFLYLASGRPIIAGRTRDVQELLRDGENALLCPPDEPKALVARIQTLLDDPALACRLAGTALTESQRYTWDARAQRLSEVITERQTAQPARGSWGPEQSRRWRRNSGRWLAGLLCKGAWVLPTEPLTSTPDSP